MVSNLEAARSGDRRVALEAARDLLARTLDECEPTMVAQTVGQYRATLKELAELEPAVGRSVRDELKARRVTRAGGRAEAPVAKPAGGDRKPRSGA